MARRRKRKRQVASEPLEGCLILTVWGSLVAIVATGTGSLVAVIFLYLVLMILVGLQHQLFRDLVASYPIDGPVSWGVFFAILSFGVIIAAPVVGLAKLAKAFSA